MYNKANFDDFRTALSDYNWNTCFSGDSIHEICDSWTSAFLNIASQFIPNKMITVRPKDSPWYTTELRNMKRRLDRLHKKAKNSNNPEHWALFREVRNQYCRSLKNAENEYEIKISNKLKDNTNFNPKMWWKIAKSFLGCNYDNHYPPIKDGNTVHFDDQCKAEAFNSFFLKHSNIDTSHAHLPDPIRHTNNELTNIKITESDVIELLKCIDISKSTGPDAISPRMLKEAGKSISP